jgi:predicted metalloprotease
VKWTPGGQSDDLEDIRGAGGGGRRGIGLPHVAGGGIVLALLLALASQVFNIDLTGGGDEDTTQSQQEQYSSAPARRRSGPDPDQREMQFMSFVIDDVQKTFEKMFEERGLQYRHAHLVVFTDDVDTGCGESSAAVGPFYCPPDQKAYVDLSFFRELKDRFGAAGEFAQAYVIAHELGHHVQNLMGIEQRERRRGRRDFSVRLELQADCFAGVWGHSTDQRHLLDPGEAKEAMDAAAAIGDDRLQKMAGRRVNPETWTHGSSEERVRWFTRGFESGRFEDCDTFSAPEL